MLELLSSVPLVSDCPIESGPLLLGRNIADGLSLHLTNLTLTLPFLASCGTTGRVFPKNFQLLSCGM